MCIVRLQQALFVVLFISAFLVAASARAATNSGIDTPQGVTSLPLSVEGNEGMALVEQGSSGPVYVGVGTANPQVPLDVSGAVRPGTASTGGNCTAPGAIAYDPSSNAIIYCSNASNPCSWKAMGTWVNDPSPNGTPFNGNCDYRVQMAAGAGCGNTYGTGYSYMGQVTSTDLEWWQDVFGMLVSYTNRTSIRVSHDQVGVVAWCTVASLQYLCQ